MGVVEHNSYKKIFPMLQKNKCHVVMVVMLFMLRTSGHTIIAGSGRILQSPTVRLLFEFLL